MTDNCQKMDHVTIQWAHVLATLELEFHNAAVMAVLLLFL